MANAVVGTVLRSHISHFLYHKVISASRLKEEGKESSCNMENWPKDIIHVSFDASSIKWSANGHCYCFLVTIFQLIDQMINLGNCEISLIVNFYRFRLGGVLARSCGTWRVLGFWTVMPSFLETLHIASWDHFACFALLFWRTGDNVLTTYLLLPNTPSLSLDVPCITRVSPLTNTRTALQTVKVTTKSKLVIVFKWVTAFLGNSSNPYWNVKTFSG